MGNNRELENVQVPWKEWRAVRVLGTGSFGKVYEIQKEEEDGRIQCAALKIMKIPLSREEIYALRADGRSNQEIDAYFYKEASRLKNEIILMEELQTAANIVSIKDSRIIKEAEGEGCQLFIMMELLTSLDDYFYSSTENKDVTVQKVIKVGCDICDALSACEKRNIIHRDIKPSNIFVSDFEDFKLGDFGVSRQKEHTRTQMSQQGTLGYMAPEIFNESENYDGTVDIYSLGLVLYRLLNWGRIPFVSLDGDAPSYEENVKAHKLRLLGTPFPDPALGNQQLADILRKACSYDPGDRYQKADDMKNALLKCQFAMSEEELNRRIIRTNAEISQNKTKPDYKSETIPLKPKQKPDHKIHTIQPDLKPVTEIPDPEPPDPEFPVKRLSRRKIALIVVVSLGIILGAGAVMFGAFTKEDNAVEDLMSYMNNYEIEEAGRGTGVFGNSEISKDEIKSIEVLDTISEAPDTAWDISSKQTGEVKAWVTGSSGSYELYLAAEGGIKISDCRYLFANYSNVEEISLSGLDTGSVKEFGWMFVNCRNLTMVNLMGIDTSAAESMYFMFGNCTSLTGLDVSGLNTGNVIYFDGMFSGCESLLSLNVKGFKTGSAEIMSHMFQNCTSLTELDLSEFDTQNVTEFASMFLNCTNLRVLNLESFDVSSATNAQSMFQNCESLTSLTGISSLQFSEDTNTDNIYTGSGMESGTIKQNLKGSS